MSRLIRFSPFVLSALALSGCVSIGAGGDPPEQLITLTPAQTAPAGSTSQGMIDSAIFVFEPEVEDRLDMKRVPVQIDASSIAYLQDAFYVDRPARLFQSLLAETLRATTGRLVVEQVDPGLPSRVRLYGKLVDMGYDAPSSTVKVTYDAVRVDQEGHITSQRFSESIPGVAPTAVAVAPALNEAANAVAAEVAAWMKAAG